ncbi:MAG: thiamine diphosphokinase [Chloroflexi bacterium]|nr:MAG: thiamine diphosphokinase [Chloroflexota bacterium]
MGVLIFVNGELEGGAWIRPFLVDAAAIIAANGGTQHLHTLNVLPHIVIGDLDSLPLATKTWLETADTRFIPHPRDKDETDMELALLYAAEQYPDASIAVFGALGGRLDQEIANILLLAHPALRGREVTLVTRSQTARLIDEYTSPALIQGQVGDTVSLLPLGGDVRVRQTTGLRWELQDDILRFGPARGVSNEMTNTKATVVVAAGKLLCVHLRRL